MDEQIAQPPIEGRIDDIANQLTSIIRLSPHVMIWIGSGLSMGCGYPDWQGAIEKLCLACIPGKSDIPPSALADDLLQWAAQCKATDPDKYFAALVDMFGRTPHVIRSAYSHICSCGFRYLITTNFDPCLETASVKHSDLLAYPDLFLPNASQDYTLLYLHGKVRSHTPASARSVVFTSEDMESAYTLPSLIPSVLHILLTSQNTIFVGCGLREPVLQGVFKMVKSFHPSVSTRKFKRWILLPDAEGILRDQQDEYMEELGITPIRFPVDDNYSADLTLNYRFLDDIWERVRALQTTPATSLSDGDLK
jgi:SIR2-like domain